MGNTCTELCQEPEIFVEFDSTPLSAKSHKSQHNRGYFTESKEPVLHVTQLSKEKEKRPQYRYTTGGVYEGEWIGNKREGYGVMTWPGIFVFIILMVQNMRVNGKTIGRMGWGSFGMLMGTLVDEGEWKDDQTNGYGTYTHVNGAKYEGFWKNDQQDGYGIEQWADGSRYDGFYLQGKKHGQGKYVWPDGSYYNGNWVSNNLSGQGTYFWQDGRIYTGEWLDNQMHGEGVYQYKNGRKYEGQFQFDKKHGYGIYIWEDGRKYEGNWKDGKQQGEGVYYEQLNNKGRRGYWEDGKRYKWIDE